MVKHLLLKNSLPHQPHGLTRFHKRVTLCFRMCLSEGSFCAKLNGEALKQRSPNILTSTEEKVMRGIKWHLINKKHQGKEGKVTRQNKLMEK